MKRISIALLLGAFVLLSGTALAQTKVTRSLGSFDRIGISGGYDKITLQEGPAEMVVIEAKGVDPEKIITEVKGNTLEVHMKKGSYNDCHISMTITYRALKGVDNSGSSDIVAATPIKGESFAFNSSGSGNFSGPLEVNKLKIHISGSSDINISGKADKQEYAISGSGDVDASKLKGNEADVAISGSGDVKLNVSGSVHSAVSGSGDVTNNNN